MRRHRVLIAEDYHLVRAGLRSLLEGLPRVEVVGEADNGNDAVRLAGQLRTDVVLMDISMPGLNGIEATRRIVKLKPTPRVLVLSMHSDRQYISEALAAGASGYLLKSGSRDELELAVATVARGEMWISPSIARTVVNDILFALRTDASGTAARDALTPRQREVLQLVAEGHSTRQIARRLAISVKTVETHRAQIMERLDIHHVAGLVRYAIRAGIVRPDD
jgi:DNA-binding NarL/FixJ family response regulator